MEWKIMSDGDPTDTSAEPDFLESDEERSYWECHDCGAIIRSEGDFLKVEGASR